MLSAEQIGGGELIPRYGDPSDPDYDFRVESATRDIERSSGYRLTRDEARAHAIDSEAFVGRVQQRLAELCDEGSNQNSDEI